MSQINLRPLGCSESPFASYAKNEKEKQLAQTAVAATKFSCNYEQTVFEQAVMQSIEHIRNKYAALKCGIKKSEQGEFHFVKSPNNGLNYKCLILDSEKAAWSYFQSEAANGISEFENLLYRITLIQIKHSNTYLLIANIHHSLADGFVYDKVVGEILSVACDIASQTNISVVNHIEQQPLVAPVESFFLSDLSKWSLFKLVLRMTWRSLGRGKPIYALKETRKASWADRRSIYNQSTLAAEAFTQLKQKAKLNETTINGCLSAAMTLSFKQMLEHYPEKSILKVAHAVDLRRRLPSDKGLEDNLFCAASGINTYHEIDQLIDFWKIATETRKNLHKEIEVHRTPWRVLGAMKKTINLFDYADGPLSGRSETLGISNIGPVKSCQDCQNEHLQLDSVYIAGSIQIVGALISVIITTINDKLCFSFMACEPLIKQEELDQFANNVIQLLKDC
jgi:NRPS condensation-like uncharacterized protein